MMTLSAVERSVVLLLVLLFGAVTLAAADKPITDDMIYDHVRVKLAGDRDVGGENIQVKVTQGVVELSGVVRREGMRSKAEKIAKRVKGVQKVVNQLKVSTAI